MYRTDSMMDLWWKLFGGSWRLFPLMSAIIIISSMENVSTIPVQPTIDDMNPVLGLGDDVISVNDPENVVVGDMILTKDQFDSLIHDDKDPRKGVLFEYRKWPDEPDFPTVPYNITDSGKEILEVITGGMDSWSEHTCIKFRPSTEKDKNFINFFQGRGCTSIVGRYTIDRYQDVSLGRGCHVLDTVIHEIGHAIGLLHEQMRPDRDDYLEIVYGNIRKNKEVNFMRMSKHEYGSYEIPFDHTSIMMYPARDFSSTGSMTMKSKNPFHLGLMGRGKELSHRDKAIVNVMYGCLDKWLETCHLKKNNCQNEGYVGKDCSCICPPGTDGRLCQDKVGDYNSKLLPSCSKVISTNNTEIQSPNYPHTEIPDTWCVFKIVAPEDHYITVKFDHFQLDTYWMNNPRCRIAVMIFIEYKVEQDNGTATCGKDLDSGGNYTSDTNELVIYYEITSNSRYSKGFFGSVQFYADEMKKNEVPKTTQTTFVTPVTKGTTSPPSNVSPTSPPSKDSSASPTSKASPTLFSYGFCIALIVLMLF